MRIHLLAGLAVAGLAAGPAFAQNTTRYAPPTSAYQGGAGSPTSTQSTDVVPNGQVIGSRLPQPDAASDRPEALLRSALRALDRRQTGEAQEALEMAETRILSRTTPPDRADMPAPQAMVQHISAARQALGHRDIGAARAEIRMAMASPPVPPGPALTMVPGPGMAPVMMPPGGVYASPPMPVTPRQY